MTIVKANKHVTEERNIKGFLRAPAPGSVPPVSRGLREGISHRPTDSRQPGAWGRGRGCPASQSNILGRTSPLCFFVPLGLAATTGVCRYDLAGIRDPGGIRAEEPASTPSAA
jgi:hypothetical protein